jgi:excisionase family DNA binding protein
VKLTVNQAAKVAGVSPSAVRRWINSGALPALLLPGSQKQPIVRVESDELEALLKRCDTRLQSSARLTLLTQSARKHAAR